MKLLPCPFCGNDKPQPAHAWMRFVECKACGAYGPSPLQSGDREMEAISANVRWNERAELEELYRWNAKRKPKP